MGFEPLIVSQRTVAMEIRAHVKRPIGLLLLGGLVFHLLELPTFSLWGDLDFEGIRGCECLEKREAICVLC
jgi:hypothetical protein